MQVGDPFAGLVLEVREQTGQVLDGVPSLLGLGQRRGERLNEGLQTRQQTRRSASGDTWACANISCNRVSNRRSITSSLP